MTRREWAELAAVINQELDGWTNGAVEGYQVERRDGAITAIRIVATRLGIVLQRNHARFDLQRFLKECGL